MEKLLEFLVKSLVEDESAVRISKDENDNEISFVVKVASGDLGKVIGKSGKTASGIRTIMKSVASKSHKKVYVKFED